MPHAETPRTIAEARAELDRLAHARNGPRTEASQREWCQRIAELWWDEARTWTSLTRATDLPRDTDLGALLSVAAGHAAQFAHARGVSWWASSGDPEIHPEPPPASR